MRQILQSVVTRVANSSENKHKLDVPVSVCSLKGQCLRLQCPHATHVERKTHKVSLGYNFSRPRKLN
jgi:hypothetical protein